MIVDLEAKSSATLASPFNHQSTIINHQFLPMPYAARRRVTPESRLALGGSRL
jgi:hypothetical protein